MASNLEIKLKSQETPYTTELTSTLEIEWRIEVDGGNVPSYRLTFRADSNANNDAYYFLNNLIINQKLVSIADIEQVGMSFNDTQYYLSGDKISNITTTSSIKSVEVCFHLKGLSAASELPFLKGE